MGNQEMKVSLSRAVMIEFVMFFTYAFFAVNWIAGSTLTPQIMEHFNDKICDYPAKPLIYKHIRRFPH